MSLVKHWVICLKISILILMCNFPPSVSRFGTSCSTLVFSTLFPEWLGKSLIVGNVHALGSQACHRWCDSCLFFLLHSRIWRNCSLTGHRLFTNYHEFHGLFTLSCRCCIISDKEPSNLLKNIFSLYYLCPKIMTSCSCVAGGREWWEQML